MMQLSIGYLIRNLVRGTIHPTSEEAGILYPLTPFFIKLRVDVNESLEDRMDRFRGRPTDSWLSRVLKAAKRWRGNNGIRDIG
jgi:hypothetical protein